MVFAGLIERRLVILSGKGGVGKSVVAAALALAARERGKRVLVVEIDAPHEIARRLGAPETHGVEQEALPGLFTVNLEPRPVMDEYVRQVVKLGPLARLILESPVYDRFFTAAPGLKELMLLGKIVVLSEARDGWSRRPRYDLVIVDAPATGHGLALLKVPIAASAAIPVGPVGYQARWILQQLRDRKKTALALLAVPEEMAVTEALEFHRMAVEEVGIEPSALFLNACHERRLSDAEEAEVLRLTSIGANGRLAAGVPLRAALLAARRHMRRSKLTRFYERRLKRALPVPVVCLPFLFETDFGMEALQRLAARIAAA
jgi:anion-transporting  ArsA/GET3 family ATPase